MATLSSIAPSPEPTAGAEIKKLRQRRGLSLRQLANQAKISASALSRWEAEKRTPSIPELEAVFAALQATTAQKQTVLRRINAPRAALRLRALDQTGSQFWDSRGGGDLLWAMRQRKGWTQAQAAQAARTTQTQIARWERNEAWPDAHALHTLCWCLEARPEELAALTQSGGDSNFGEGLFCEDVSEWDDQQWNDYVFRLLHHPPPIEVFELTCIAAEQRLIRLAADRDFAGPLLSEVYAIHARHHMSLHQGRQAILWAERGLALARQNPLPSKSSTGRATVWFGSVLASASYLSARKRSADLRRAVRLLHDWLPMLNHDDPHYPWAQIVIARNLGKLGRADEALNMGNAACKKAERMGPSEGFMRWRDFAGILLSVQKPTQALHALNRSGAQRDLCNLSPDAKARHYLLEAECFWALGDTRSAGERARDAEQIVTEHQLWYLQDELHRATAPL